MGSFEIDCDSGDSDNVVFKQEESSHESPAARHCIQVTALRECVNQDSTQDPSDDISELSTESGLFLCKCWWIPKRKMKQLVCLALGASLMAIAVVAVALCASGICAVNGQPQQDEQQQQQTPVTPPPTPAPINCDTEPRGKAFESTQELYKAVDDYLDSVKDGAVWKNEYGRIECWEVSRIVDFTSVFDAKRNPLVRDYFTPDVLYWDTSNATTLKWMFQGARSFDGDVSGFVTSNVEDFFEMFARAVQFSGDLSLWDVRNAVRVEGMCTSIGLILIKWLC